MNRLSAFALAAVAATVSLDASAFSQETHRRIAMDAVNYMRNIIS